MKPVVRAALKLRKVIRYSTYTLIHPQNDAEHVFQGSSIVYELLRERRAVHGPCPEEEFATLAEFLMHDLHESYTGDLLHTFKCSNPEITQAVERAEKSVENGFDFYHRDKVCWDIVRAADIAECLCYLGHELSLGNRDPEVLNMHLFAYVRTYGWSQALRSQTLRGLCNSAALFPCSWNNLSYSTILQDLEDHPSVPLNSTSELRLVDGHDDPDRQNIFIRPSDDVKLLAHSIPVDLSKAYLELSRNSFIKWVMFAKYGFGVDGLISVDMTDTYCLWIRSSDPKPSNWIHQVKFVTP